MWQPRIVRSGAEIRKEPLIVAPPVGLRGRMSWRVFNEDGTPALADVRTADGSVRRVHDMTPQHNLILNGGLDDWCQVTGLQAGGFSSDVSMQMRTWLRVGTSSVAPAVTDTALAAEVQTSTTAGTGSLGETVTIISPTLARYAAQRTVRMTMGVDRNLTEYGFSRLETSPLLVRELFRDEFDVPITISILAGKILQVDHVLEADIVRSGQVEALNILSYDVGNTLIATDVFTMEVGFFLPWDLTAANVSEAVSQAISPGLQNGGSTGTARSPKAFGFTSAVTLPKDMSDTTGFTPNPDATTETHIAGISLGAYTAGTFARQKTFTFPDTILAGANIYAIAVGHYVTTSGLTLPANVAGWIFKFTSPAMFTKLATNTLSVRWQQSLTRV